MVQVWGFKDTKTGSKHHTRAPLALQPLLLLVGMSNMGWKNSPREALHSAAGEGHRKTLLKEMELSRFNKKTL